MAPTRFRHLNNCPRCPVLGAGDHPGVEYFQALSLSFHVPIARELCRESVLHRVERTPLKSWLTSVHILPAHLYHLPPNPGPGIMVTLPSGLGRPLIDGNHRAARALRDGTEFLAYLLPEVESLELLRRSMGRAAADDRWRRLLNLEPQHKDEREGEEH
jgi:hypothetical protein